MHRSAAPDAPKKHRNARRDGVIVSHEEQDATSRHPEHQGTGHDERGRYGSADRPNSPDQVKPSRG